MFDALYGWIQNMVFFLLLAGMMLDVLPGKTYRKYVRFFAGTVVILLMVSPLLRLSGIKQNFDNIYHGEEYERMLREVESMEGYFEEEVEQFWQDTQQDASSGDVDTQRDVVDGDSKENRIEVEEVRIGE